jgi:hypothetical protein
MSTRTRRLLMAQQRRNRALRRRLFAELVRLGEEFRRAVQEGAAIASDLQK